MTRSSRYCVLTAAFLLFMAGCDDPVIEPGPFNYPVQLNVSQKDHAVRLQWTQVDVSTFEEYVILRSTDSIPDNSEPEVVGLTTVVQRIDDRELVTFEDFQPPLEPVVYYKIYADIGERFLMSATLRVDLSFQLIDFRADASIADTVHNEIIGFDRTRDLLFRYDYAGDDEILANAVWSMSNPIIRIADFNGAREIYLCDRNSVIFILNGETLELKQTVSMSSSVVDFVVTEGLVIATRSDGTVAVYDRATRQFRSLTGSVSSNQKFLAARKTGSDEVTVWEFSLTQVARYKIAGALIGPDLFKDIVVSGSAPLLATRPDHKSFVMSNFGQVMNDDLEPVTTLENGSQFYQTIAYDPTGTRVFTSGFGITTPQLKTFDVTDNYARLDEHPFNFTPTFMFADNGKLYALGILFINGAVRTVIAKIDYE